MLFKKKPAVEIKEEAVSEESKKIFDIYGTIEEIENFFDKPGNVIPILMLFRINKGFGSHAHRESMLKEINEIVIPKLQTVITTDYDFEMFKRRIIALMDVISYMPVDFKLIPQEFNYYNPEKTGIYNRESHVSIKVGEKERLENEIASLNNRISEMRTRHIKQLKERNDKIDNLSKKIDNALIEKHNKVNDIESLLYYIGKNKIAGAPFGIGFRDNLDTYNAELQRLRLYDDPSFEHNTKRIAKKINDCLRHLERANEILSENSVFIYHADRDEYVVNLNYDIDRQLRQHKRDFMGLDSNSYRSHLRKREMIEDLEKRIKKSSEKLRFKNRL